MEHITTTRSGRVRRTSRNPGDEGATLAGLAPADGAIVAVLAAGAAFDFYQLGSGLFACGRDLAGWEARPWLALSAVQGLLFLLGAQWPIAFVALGQLARAYPRPFIAIVLFRGAC